MLVPPVCPLDPLEYNLSSAWLGQPSSYFPTGWRACRHGVGAVDVMRKCGCVVCVEKAVAIEEGQRPGPLLVECEPDPPKRVDVTPVREHIEQLKAAGWSRRDIAVAAGIDATTITRALRPDVQQVHVDTATALLAIVP